MSDLTPSLARSISPADDDFTATLRDPFAETAEGPALQHYWAVLRKRHVLIVTFLIGTLLATGITLFFMPVTYTAETTLLIERHTPQVLDFREVLADWRGMESYDFYKTQYEILKSRILAARVIQEQGLNMEPLFTGHGSDEGLMRRVVHTVKGWVTVAQNWLAQQPSSPPSSGGNDLLVAQSELIDRYLGMLEILPTQKTQLVKVGFKTPDAQLSARLANAHAQAYIRQGRERRSLANEEAQSFLEERLGELKGRVEQSEAALNRYRQTKGIISLNDKENVVVERLVDLNKRLTEAEVERIGLESQVHLIRKRRYESLADVINSTHIQTLTAQALRLEGEYANLASLFKPGYSRLDQLRSQVEATRRQLREEIRKVVDGVESSYLAAAAKEKQLRSVMEKQKTAALRLKDVSVGYAILVREVDTNRLLYDSVLQRMKETGVAAELQSSNVLIIDKATPFPLPSSPKIKQSFLLVRLSPPET